MLEYDFNDLDNDFVTLWSDYILNHDKNKIYKNITILAEKGQINAVQSYYVLNKENKTNDIIDKIVDSYHSNNMNELIAQSLREYILDKNYIKTLENKYDQLQEELKQTCWENTTEENGQLHDAIGLTELDLKETLYHSFLEAGIKCGVESYMLTKNILAAQRVLEIQPMSFVESGIKYKKVRKELIKALEKAVEENSKDIDAYKFALAKNLVFFKSSKKEHALGLKMIKELAGRPLLTIKETKNQEDEKTF